MLYGAGNSRQRRTELNVPPLCRSEYGTPVGGITPFTTVDMPEHTAAVFYFQGCPYRCPYCHNPQFQKKQAGAYSITQLDDFLKQRAGFLDGVVFSGGEPLLHPKAVIGMGQLAMTYGYRVGLHTTGHASDHLNEILERVDVNWVGLDLKGPAEDLDTSTGTRNSSLTGFKRSLEQLRKSGIPTEVRTTIHKGIAHETSLDRLVGTLAGLNIQRPVWQIEAINGRPHLDLKKHVSDYLESRQLTSWITVR